MQRRSKGRIKVRPQSALDTCQHMSNHYRRILNAKPSVDTSIPKSFNSRIKKRCPPILSSSSSSNWSDLTTKENLIFENKMQQITLDENRKANRRLLELKQGILDKQDCFKQPLSSFQPRILQTEIPSKVRQLHVYHPPRRKNLTKVADKIITSELRKEPEKALAIDVCRTSSRDSAYSGGISSVPETRNATPIQRAHDNPYMIKKNSISTQTDFKNNNSTRNLEEMYTKFILDITQEVVDKGLFTNRSISRVMRQHYSASTCSDKNRMCDQLIQMANQLGIPIDDEYLSWLNYEKKLNRPPKKGKVYDEKSSPLIEDSTDEEEEPIKVTQSNANQLNTTFIIDDDSSDTKSKKSTVIEVFKDNNDNESSTEDEESFEESVASSESDQD